MTGIERRQCEMLVRVRNFGENNRVAFEGSPGALQTFAEVSAAVAELAAADAKKLNASAAVRGERRLVARRSLQQMLQDIVKLADHRRAEGKTMPAFAMPASRSDLSLLTAGRVFAEDAAAVDADFSAHGLGPSHIRRATTALEAAVNDQGMSRTDHVAARMRIRELVTGALRSVRRLDMILTHDLAADPVMQAQWEQLRRIEYPARPRTAATPATEGEPPAPTDAVKEEPQAPAA